MPKDRVDAIRAAYVKTMQDPKFIVGVRQQNMAIDPMSGEEISKIVKDLYAKVPMGEGMVRAFIWPYAQWPVMKVYALQMAAPVLQMLHITL
mgnify:CR=1 FL=1